MSQDPTLDVARPVVAPTPRRRRRIPTLWRGVIGVGVLAVGMEVFARSGLTDERFLPPLSIVLAKLGQQLVDPEFLLAVLATAGTWFVGLLLAAALAIPIGVLLGLSEFSYRVSRAAIDLIRPVPPIALIPLVILVLGQTFGMKIALVLFAAVWPILFNTISGVRDVDPQLIQMGRSFQYGRFTIIRRIILPAAAPFIATGVRISSSIALIVVVTVELIAGGSQGLGAYIAEARAIGTDVPRIFAGTLMTGALGLLINSGLGALERRFFGWHERKDV